MEQIFKIALMVCTSFTVIVGWLWLGILGFSLIKDIWK